MELIALVIIITNIIFLYFLYKKYYCINTKKSKLISKIKKFKPIMNENNILIDKITFPYVIGVCGGTGSGKTTICNKIIHMAESKFKIPYAKMLL